jgi:hypothetical protein
MLPSTLKYSCCPSEDVKTLCKPPINFYGGLRSRLRIITVIFTRQGTKTTGREERHQVSLSLHLGPRPHGEPQPTERGLMASTNCLVENYDKNPNFRPQKQSFLKGWEERDT